MPKDFESDTYDDDCEKNSLPVILFDLLSQSCLVPAMSSYLRNDSGKKLQKYFLKLPYSKFINNRREFFGYSITDTPISIF